MENLKGLIIAKQNSNRLPGKNTLDFNGEPMFLTNVKKCLEIFDEVYVSSDSKDILALAEEVGAKTIIRGEELCGETPNVKVYQHAIKHMGDVSGIVAVQANSPTVESKNILLAKYLLEAGLQEVMTSHPVVHQKKYHDQNAKIYGSVWGMSKNRLEHYPDPYKPNPDALLTDYSIDIETIDEYQEALKTN